MQRCGIEEGRLLGVDLNRLFCAMARRISPAPNAFEISSTINKAWRVRCRLRPPALTRCKANDLNPPPNRVYFVASTTTNVAPLHRGYDLHPFFGGRGFPFYQRAREGVQMYTAILPSNNLLRIACSGTASLYSTLHIIHGRDDSRWQCVKVI